MDTIWIPLKIATLKEKKKIDKFSVAFSLIPIRLKDNCLKAKFTRQLCLEVFYGVLIVRKLLGTVFLLLACIYIARNASKIFGRTLIKS